MNRTQGHGATAETPGNAAQKEAAARYARTRRKLVLYLLGLAMALSALTLRPILRARAAEQVERLLQAAEIALDAGDHSQATALAQLATKRAHRSADLLARSLIMLGAARIEKAEQTRRGDYHTLLAIAAQNLAEASKADLVGRDKARLNFYLGKCLHARSLQQESIPLLQQSLETYPAGRSDALRLLTSAYMDPARNDLERARWANSEFLRTPGLSAEAIAEAWGTRREIVRRSGKPDLLSDIDLPARSDLRWTASLVEAYESYENRDYDQVIEVCGHLVQAKELPDPVARRTWFLLGLAARDNGDDELALETFRRIEWRYPNTDEARAAAAYSGAVLLRQEKLGAAIAALGRAVQAPGADAKSMLLGGLTLTRVIGNAVDRLRDEHQFEAALELIEASRQVNDGMSADRAIAGLYESWARHKLLQAQSVGAMDAEQVRYQAAELFRLAGIALTRLADASTGPEAVALRWQAAQNLAQGEHFGAALDSLEQLLEGALAVELEPSVLALACAVLEASGQVERVAEFADLCIRKFPDHPAAAKARYHLARAEIVRGDYRTAEENLRAILHSPKSEADLAIAQRARLILAHLLADQAREEEAIPRIEEMLAKPTDAADRLDARLLWAECLRRRARRPASRIAESQSEPAKAHYRQLRAAVLDQALGILASLQRELAALERAEQLTPTLADWLHQCRWAMADCLYEAEQYADAIELYKEIAEIYTEPADWLQAQMQIANCLVCLNELGEARAVLRAAQTHLERAPDDAEQAQIGMSPSRWKEWLDWTRQL